MIREDEDTVAALRGAMATAVRGHHLGPDVADPAVARLESDPPRWRRREYLAVAAACLVVAGTATGIYAAAGSRSRPAAGPSCDGAAPAGPLPTWARAGFIPPDQSRPQIMGTKGQIVAIPFVDPLLAPPRPGPSNKILWVAKDHGTGPLTIRAQLEGSDRSVVRTVDDGPGPSIIDMPVAGCWRMTLSWSGHTDTLAIPYAP